MAAELIERLRRCGGHLIASGDRLRVQAPVPLPEALLTELRAHKIEIMAELVDDPPALEAGMLVSVRERLGAVLIRSTRFGEVWLALDPHTTAELRAEEGQRRTPRPVLETEDIAHLRGKPEAVIRAVLEVARVFPGAKMLQ